MADTPHPVMLGTDRPEADRDPGAGSSGAIGPGGDAAPAAAPCRTPLAGDYPRLHARFLRLAGGEAEAAQEAALSMLLRPGLHMLDAGCGPATVARRLLAVESRLNLTLLDTDPQMLDQCRDLDARQVTGSLARLPLADCSFDVAFALWSVETLADPAAGLRELVRVTRPGGWVAVTFCARCPKGDWLDRCLEVTMGIRRSGRMLDPEMVCGHLKSAGLDAIRPLHCRGPARALIGRRAADHLRSPPWSRTPCHGSAHARD